MTVFPLACQDVVIVAAVRSWSPVLSFGVAFSNRRCDQRPDGALGLAVGRFPIKAVVLPFTVGGTDQAKDLFGLYDDTVNRLLAGLKK